MGNLKLGDIIRLLKAGYTKEEINELKDLESEPEPEPEPDPKEPDQKEGKEPAGDPEPAAGISDLAKELNGLKEMLQDHFRSGAEGKTPEAAAGEQVLKDILEKGVL